jgi:hypothetical protein
MQVIGNDPITGEALVTLAELQKHLKFAHARELVL